jgi:dipeptidyl aminopeptidase/acylaminoacyl peptidase
MRRFAFLLACSVLAAPVLAAPAPALAQQQANAAPVDGPSRTFTGNDLFGLSIAADPQISPDGRTIVYVRRTGDIMTDRMQSSLWLIDVASGKQTPFATSGSSPRWSPDGTRVAYVAADGERAQLFVRWVGNGASTRVTSLPGDPNSLS